MLSLACLVALTTVAAGADDAPYAEQGAAARTLVLTPSEPTDLDSLRAEVQRLQLKRIGLGLPVTLMATGSGVATLGALLFVIGMTSGLAPLINVPTLMGLVGLVTGVPMVGFGVVGLRWRIKDRGDLKADLEGARPRLREAEEGASPVMPTGPAPSPFPAARLEVPLTTLARF
jgi:hypothetical protein